MVMTAAPQVDAEHPDVVAAGGGVDMLDEPPPPQALNAANTAAQAVAGSHRRAFMHALRI
jgi:hypothetical protein